MRSHLQTVNYSIQIGDHVIEKIAIFNQNKLPTGVAMKCIETDTFNKYLLTMTKEHYVALFLDDGELTFSEDEPVEDAQEGIPSDVVEQPVDIYGDSEATDAEK